MTLNPKERRLVRDALAFGFVVGLIEGAAIIYILFEVLR